MRQPKCQVSVPSRLPVTNASGARYILAQQPGVCAAAGSEPARLVQPQSVTSNSVPCKAYRKSKLSGLTSRCQMPW